jgi:hypothetical protein
VRSVKRHNNGMSEAEIADVIAHASNTIRAVKMCYAAMNYGHNARAGVRS